MRAAFAWRALPRGVRGFFGMVCCLLGYLLLDTVSHICDVGSGVSLWYLPAALLFVFSLRYLPLVFAVVVAVQLVHDATHPFLSTLVYALTFSLTYGAAALVLRRLNIDPGLCRLRDVGWFMFVGVVAAPLAASLMSVTNFTGSATLTEWSLLVPQYAAGDATGGGALAPFCWSYCATSRCRSLPRRTCARR